MNKCKKMCIRDRTKTEKSALIKNVVIINLNLPSLCHKLNYNEKISFITDV